MNTEDILYAAWHRGVKTQVLDIVEKQKYAKGDESTKISNAYSEVLDLCIASGTIEYKSWNSSMINSSTYNFSENTLTIEFNNLVEYTYENVSKIDYDSFIESESKGKHFSNFIRNSKEFKKNDD